MKWISREGEGFVLEITLRIGIFFLEASISVRLFG